MPGAKHRADLGNSEGKGASRTVEIGQLLAHAVIGIGAAGFDGPDWRAMIKNPHAPSFGHVLKRWFRQPPSIAVCAAAPGPGEFDCAIRLSARPRMYRSQRQGWPDIVAGLLIAGALAAWVPSEFWQRFFLVQHPVAAILWGPIVGPIVAMLSFVCSIGNVPLAAVLWNGGISFGGVIAFIFADLIVLPILNIYRKYYGGPMTVLLGSTRGGAPIWVRLRSAERTWVRFASLMLPYIGRVGPRL